MAQAKKKTATKTTKKAARPVQARKKQATRSCCKVRENKQEKFHVYVVTALSFVTVILLCANAAMMMV